MSENLDYLSQIQTKILKETKRTLESEKLSIWSYKADLNTVGTKIIKVQNQIILFEESFFNNFEEARLASHELEFIVELINTNICEPILKQPNPWTIIKDICGGISKMLGFSDVSWNRFQVMEN